MTEVCRSLGDGAEAFVGDGATSAPSWCALVTATSERRADRARKRCSNGDQWLIIFGSPQPTPTARCPPIACRPSFDTTRPASTCGRARVTVDDWEGWSPDIVTEWQARYDAEQAPIHGTSLGMSGTTYRRAGGFSELAHGEDRAIYEAAVLAGGNVFRDRSVHVVTSGRRKARAPLGFSSALSSMERTIAVGARRGEVLADLPSESELLPALSYRHDNISRRTWGGT